MAFDMDFIGNEEPGEAGVNQMIVHAGLDVHGVQGIWHFSFIY